jgi:hypothetical protein
VAAPGSITVTVNQPSVAPTSLSSPVTICSGSNTTLTQTGGVLGTGASWKWYTNSTYTTPAPGTVAADGSLTVSPTTTTTYYLRAESSTGAPCTANVASGNVTVTVNEPVAITTQPNPSQPVCLSLPASFSVAATGTGLTYQWYLGGNAIAGATSSTYNIAKVQQSDGGTYTVVVSGAGNVCTPQTSDAAVLTVNQTITANVTPSTDTTCERTTATFTVSTTGTVDSYQWRRNGKSIFDGGNVSGTNTATLTITGVVPGVNDGSYDVVVSGPAGQCSQVISNVATLTVTPTVGTPVFTSGVTSSRCQSAETVTYSATATNTTGITYSLDATSTSAGNSIDPATGTVTYVATWTGTSVITASAAGCNGSVTSTHTVTINPTPVITTANTATICSGGTTNIGLTASVTSTYSWSIGTITGGITGASSGSGSTISQTLTNPGSTTAGSVQYLVTPTATTGSCAGSSYTITVTVNPSPVVTTPNTASVCSGGTTNIGLTASVASSFSWTVGTITGGITGASSGSGSTIGQTLTNPGNTTAGTVQYLVTPTATTGSCAGSPYTITVTVNPSPVVTTPNTASVCSGTTNIGLTASVASSFSWTVGTITGGITGASSGSGNTIGQTLTNPGNTTAGSVQYLVTPTATTGSCAGSAYTITVTVNPSPVVTTPNTASVCSGGTTNIGLTASVASTYSWSIGTITGGITGASSGSGSTIGQTLTNPGSTTAGSVQYLVTPTATTGSCAGSPYTITVTVNPTPVVTTPNTASVCSGGTTNIGLTATVASTYSWTVGTITGGITGASSGSGSTISQVLTNPGNAAAGSVQYLVTPTAATGLCGGNPYTITVTVNPLPVVTAANTASVCTGSSSQIALAASTSGNNTFTWTIGTVSGVSGPTASSGTTISQVLTVSGSTTGTVEYLVTPKSAAGCVGPQYSIVASVYPLSVGGTLSIAGVSTSPNNVITLCPSPNNATINLAGNVGTVTWQQSTNGGNTWNTATGTASQTSLQLSNVPTTIMYRAVVTSGPCSVAYSTNAVVSVIPSYPPMTFTPSPNPICLGQTTLLTASTGYPPVGITADQGDFNNGASDGKIWTVYNNGVVDANALNAGGDNTVPSPWRETNGPVTLQSGSATYNSADKKFAVASGNNKSILESPVFSLTGVTSTSFNFSQAYNLTTGATGKIEISTDGGTTYTTLQTFTGPATYGTVSGGVNFVKSYSIDLSNYVGLSNLRMRFNYNGNPTSSWAVDNLTTPGANLPISFVWDGPSQILSPTNLDTLRVRPTSSGNIVYNINTTIGGCPGGVATVSVTVNDTARVAQQPVSQIACPEGSAGFNIAVNGSAPSYSYIWQVSTDNGATWSNATGADYSGQNTNALTVNNLTSGNTKNGYLFRTSVSVNPSCPVSTNTALLTVKNIWLGTTNTDWNTTTNWSDRNIPTLTCDSVIILNVPNKPIIATGAEGATNHLVIKSGSKVTVWGTLHIGAGIWDDNGALDATAGKIDLNGDVDYVHGGTRPAQTIAGKMFYTPYVNNSGRIMDLQISNPKGVTVSAPTVNDTLNITGSLSFGNVSSVTLNTGDNITLVSDANNTARVADLTNGSANSGNAINGSVEVERYLRLGLGTDQHPKVWEFLATPTKGQTTFQSWMENGSFVSTSYGTQITSQYGKGAGFDDWSIYPSMKYYKPGTNYDPSSPDWDGISNTGTQIYSPNGYMLFVRGDRSIPGPFDPPNATRLRTKGTLLNYQQTVTTGATGLYTSVGNPYASPIDFGKVTKNNVDDFYTVWKSFLGGMYGYGAYETYTNLGNGIYESAGGEDYKIQSGEAFFVQGTNGAGSLVFNENAKTSGNSNLVFRGSMPSDLQLLRGNLYYVNGDGTTFRGDGVMLQFDKKFNNKVDGMDGRKFFNSGVNLSVLKDDINLVIERMQLPEKADTVFMNFTGATVRSYRFVFVPTGLQSAGLQAYLEDRYLKKLTPINMNDSTFIDFKVENAKDSYSPKRFDIVFKKTIQLPPSFVTVTAVAKDKDIQVDWKVAHEKNVENYEVERSFDGVQFSKVATQAATNSDSSSYQWNDAFVLPGYYYYRIKMIEKSGKIQYSETVKVLIGNGKPLITIYPNPITNGIINLQFINQPGGKYGIRLMNQLGQVIVSKQIVRMNGSNTESIQWNYDLAHGIYQLQVIYPNGQMKVIKVIY